MAFTHVKNRLAQKLLGGLTPYERIFDRKPNINYFRVIGSRCYRLLPKVQRDSKLGDVSKECILVGYSWNTKGYRVYDPDEDKIYNTQDVRFVETQRKDDKDNVVNFDVTGDGDRGNNVNAPTSIPIVPKQTMPKVISKIEQPKVAECWERRAKQRPMTGSHPGRYDATLSFKGQTFRSSKAVIKFCEENDIDYSIESVKDSFKYNNPYVGTWDIKEVADGGRVDYSPSDSPDEAEGPSTSSCTSQSHSVDLSVYFNGLECSNVDLANPLTYKEAIGAPDRVDWDRPDIKAWCEVHLKEKYKADEYDFNPTHAVDSDSDDDVEQPRDAEIEPEVDNGEAETYSVRVYCAKVQEPSTYEEAMSSPESDK
uniref:Retroviral polymerase SH3-like domain-containing protein n=1 Tax=Strigamia maritima TaxID=126957 RepID=T1IQH5_STRMM